MIMELEELRSLWAAHDEKLNKSLQLNIKLLREVNLGKAGKKLGALMAGKIAEMAVLLFMIIYLLNFTISYFTEPGFSVPSVIIMAFIISGFISDIRQLALIVQLRDSQDAPVSQLQKKVERLKLFIVNYVKMSFISIPFYPLLMIVGGKIFFGLNCWALQHRPFLIANFAAGLLLVPLFLWLYRQLSKQNIKQVFVDGLLSGSGWNQAVSAQQFLNEIEAFEKEE